MGQTCIFWANLTPFSLKLAGEFGELAGCFEDPLWEHDFQGYSELRQRIDRRSCGR
jgi:hypothetical protein